MERLAALLIKEGQSLQADILLDPTNTKLQERQLKVRNALRHTQNKLRQARNPGPTPRSFHFFLVVVGCHSSTNLPWLQQSSTWSLSWLQGYPLLFLFLLSPLLVLARLQASSFLMAFSPSWCFAAYLVMTALITYVVFFPLSQAERIHNQDLLNHFWNLLHDGFFKKG